MTRALPFLLVAVLLPSLAPAAQPARPSKRSGPTRQEPVSRELIITDENTDELQRIYVAGRMPTVLVFRTPLARGDDAVTLVAPESVIPKPDVTATKAMLAPEKDVPAGRTFPLTVTFESGHVQVFQLVSDPAKVDLKVTIEARVTRAEAAKSPAALEATITQLQGRLDECQSTSATAGIQKVSSLILSQDFDKEPAFVVERVRNVSHLDRQSRLLVEVKASYRLFSQTYVVLTVENRDAKTWFLDKPEVAVGGGGNAADAKVVTFSTDLNGVPANEVAKVVVVFNTPAQTVGQTYTLKLLERGGSRHVSLEGVRL